MILKLNSLTISPQLIFLHAGSLTDGFTMALCGLQSVVSPLDADKSHTVIFFHQALTGRLTGNVPWGGEEVMEELSTHQRVRHC